MELLKAKSFGLVVRTERAVNQAVKTPFVKVESRRLDLGRKSEALSDKLTKPAIRQTKETQLH